MLTIMSQLLMNEMTAVRLELDGQICHQTYSEINLSSSI